MAFFKNKSDDNLEKWKEKVLKNSFVVGQTLSVIRDSISLYCAFLDKDLRKWFESNKINMTEAEYIKAQNTMVITGWFIVPETISKELHNLYGDQKAGQLYAELWYNFLNENKGGGPSKETRHVLGLFKEWQEDLEKVENILGLFPYKLFQRLDCLPNDPALFTSRELLMLSTKLISFSNDISIGMIKTNPILTAFAIAEMTTSGL